MELADIPVSNPGARKGVQVQLLLGLPNLRTVAQWLELASDTRGVPATP